MRNVIGLASLLLLCGASSLTFAQNAVGDVFATDATVKGSVMMVGNGMRVLSGSSISAGKNAAMLRLDRGGEMRICPGTAVAIATSTTGRELLLSMSVGRIEGHYNLPASADTILTPDFRILLAGPGAFNFAVSSDFRGNTCIRSMEPNSASLIVSQLSGEGMYQVKAQEQVFFRKGKIQDATTTPLLPCGCPAPQPQQASPSTEAATLPARSEPAAPQPTVAAPEAGPSRPPVQSPVETRLPPARAPEPRPQENRSQSVLPSPSSPPPASAAARPVPQPPPQNLNTSGPESRNQPVISPASSPLHQPPPKVVPPPPLPQPERRPATLARFLAPATPPKLTVPPPPQSPSDFQVTVDVPFVFRGSAPELVTKPIPAPPVAKAGAGNSAAVEPPGLASLNSFPLSPPNVPPRPPPLLGSEQKKRDFVSVLKKFLKKVFGSRNCEKCPKVSR